MKTFCNTHWKKNHFEKYFSMKKVFLQKVKKFTLGRADLKFEMSRIQQKNKNVNFGFVQIGSSFNFKKLHKNKYFFSKFTGSLFLGTWDELFWQNRLGPSIIVVWARKLVRLIENCLENIFIIYHMVIRRLEKFLRACEVQIQIFWHLKKHENQHDFSIFYTIW